MTRATFPTLARQVARGLSRLERDRICCGDITLQQYDTLRALHERAALPTSDVATTLGIDLSTASRNLAVLEKNGYLTRARGEGDARQIVNKLTRKGSRCISSLCCDERTVFDAVYEKIPASKRAAVLSALEALSRALTDADESASAPCCPPADSSPDAPRCCP